jgi:hypothetical protein
MGLVRRFPRKVDCAPLMQAQDLISAGTALFILGMIWLRTRMHYTRKIRGPMQLQRAGQIYFAVAIALLLLGWLLAPAVGHALSPDAGTPVPILRFVWFMATYLVFIMVHRVLQSRGVEVFKGIL